MVDYVLAMWMDRFQGNFQKSFLTFYAADKDHLIHLTLWFHTYIMYTVNRYIYIYIIYIYILICIWHMERFPTHFASNHDPLIRDASSPRRDPALPRWNHGAAAILGWTPRVSMPRDGKGHGNGDWSFFNIFLWGILIFYIFEMGDTTVICDQIIGIPWDIDGY